MKNPKSINEKKIYKAAKSAGIDKKNAVYELDTMYFNVIQSRKNDFNAHTVKNHFQPIQILLFNKARFLERFYVNCYIGGFPNLKWNDEHRFDTFPPKYCTPVDTLLGFNEYISQIKSLSLSDKIALQEYDYVVLVFWSKFTGRQSKRMIKQINKNYDLFGNQNNVKIIYVNTDNAFAN